MNKFLPNALLWMFIIATVFSCHSDDDMENTPENIYENCCGLAPVEMDFNPGKIYIPNIFTPNDDGINDLFYVQADDGIAMIEVFRISDEEGNVLHEKFSIFPNSVSFSWYPNEDANATHKGLFNYYVKLSNINGDVFEVNGSVCSFVCDTSNPFDILDNCGFSLQHDGVGGFDPFLPSSEEDCP